MPLLYPTSCKCSTESFVNSASPFPLLFFFDFLFFLESKGSKRKSIAGKLFFCAFGGLANVQRKTDGSHTSRPFFCFKLDVRETAFCPKSPLSRFVFCFFSSRKEIVPLLFFLEEKKQKKIICRICFCASLYILRNPVAQNGRLTYEPSVFSFQAGCAGKTLLSEMHPSAAMSFVSFLQEKKSFPKRNHTPFSCA